jgi:hypothetical protein
MTDPIEQSVQQVQDVVTQKGKLWFLWYPVKFMGFTLMVLGGTWLLKRFVEVTPWDVDDEFLESIYDDF